ncbi:AAA domain (dynein-related subfamily) [Oceanobacillus limi]|uniref:AAA domain (Dynein-related subfamily) n=1 Tax=Oceanobacillus limi TaxID=930131 RepID=A0A1H9Y1C1_9BACI|nr:AAA family ATPase [Oceanobacillus limi]SES62032.1 AAA domain (dynein-related subfamily) [Oceanobacillus limi]
MSYWVLTIHSLNNPFTYIEGQNVFQFDIRINTDVQRDGAVFRGDNIEVGDEIFGFVSPPTNEIRYIFEVMEVNSPSITLRKKLESVHGFGLEELRGLDQALYTKMIHADPNEVGKLNQIEESNFRIIETRLVEPFFNEDDSGIDDEEQEVREPDVSYERPSEDPKTANKPHNRIVFGSPGTGKSYKLEEERKKYFANNYERVTFHSNYSYGQFVGTYKPRPSDGANPITYELVPGPFLRLLAKALTYENRNYLLIVEEINRANTAAVFGDIFQLLDRDDTGKSEYNIMVSEDIKEYLENKAGINLSNNELYLPNNFYIWSTMNTADQGVHPIDSAFKRRFDFEYIGINENESEVENISITLPGIGDIDWNVFRKELNDFLLEHVRHMKEDKLIGPFFIKKSVLSGDTETFNQTFKNKLMMYLAEDVLKTNKNILFGPSSFSKIMETFDRDDDNNVFSENFTRVLQAHVN